MSRKQYIVPEGMLEATAGLLHPTQKDNLKLVLEAAVRWIAENPVCPTMDSVIEMKDTIRLGEMTVADCVAWSAVEWQRRMFLKEEQCDGPTIRASENWRQANAYEEKVKRVYPDAKCIPGSPGHSPGLNFSIVYQGWMGASAWKPTEAEAWMDAARRIDDKNREAQNQRDVLHSLDLDRRTRVQILEQMYEYHWREATGMERCLKLAGDHYTYRDAQRAHLMAAEWVKREHMGILKYVESEKRMRVIVKRVYEENERLLAAARIAGSPECSS